MAQYHYLTSPRLVRCDSCAVILHPLATRSHFQKRHNEDFAGEVLSDEELFFWTKAGAELRPRIPELPVHEGFMCERCGYCSKVQKSVYNKCRENDGIAHERTKIFVQELFGGNLKTCFRVQPPTNPENETLFPSGSDLARALEGARQPISADINRRSTSLFLEMSGWGSHLEGQDWEVVERRTAVLKEGEQGWETMTETAALLLGLHDRIPTAPYSIRGALYPDPTSRDSAKRMVQLSKSTLSRYIIIAQRLVAFTLREADNSRPAPTLDLLTSLLATPFTTHASNDWSRVLFRFVVCANVQGGRYAAIDNVTGVISALQYLTRLLVMKLMVENAAGPTAELKKLLVEGENTPFSLLRECSHLAWSHHGTVAHPPAIVWKDLEKTTVGIDNKVFSLDDLRFLVSVLGEQLDALSDLLVAALPGDQRQDLFSSLETCRNDEPANTTLYFSFADCASNQLLKAQDLLLNAVIKDSREAGGAFDRRKIIKWMEDYEEFEGLLVTLVHITAGGPARGDEYGGMLARNTAHQSRSIFIVNGVIMLSQSYSKTSRAKQTELPVPRFLPKRLSSHLKFNLIACKRLYAVLHQQATGENQMTAILDSLFFLDGKADLGDTLSKNLSRWSSKILRRPVNISQWRHIFSAFSDAHVQPVKATTVNRLAAQMGHSVRTHNDVYGPGRENLHLGRDLLQEHLLECSLWQELLGLDAQDDAISHLPATSFKANYQMSASASASASSLSAVRPQVEPIVFRPAPASALTSSHSIRTASALALNCLRKTLGDEAATFRSVEQARALELVLQGQEDAIVVLPTGSGKSLLFLGPAMVEPTGLSVVVCPLTALTGDLILRCSRLGISATRWVDSTEEASDWRIVFAGVEDVASRAFRQWLLRQHARDNLRRLFVDEVHLSITSAAYRATITHLFNVRFLAVPLVLLSATIPPSMEDEIALRFACTGSVIRAATNRSNIRYSLEISEDLPACLLRLSLFLARDWTDLDRGIIFVKSRAVAHQLRGRLAANGLLAGAFEGSMSRDEKEAVLAQWRSGVIRWVVGTSGFGAGIDYPSVRASLHFEGSYSVIDFAQESGRVGRDGHPAQSILIVPAESQGPDLWQSKTCIRAILSSHLDAETVNCFSLPAASLCSVCQQSASSLQFPESSLERSEKRARLQYGADHSRRQAYDESALASKVAAILETAGRCPICLWEKTFPVNHAGMTCRHLIDTCTICTSPSHGENQCPLRKQRNVEECFRCWFPHFVGEIDLHGAEGADFGSPQCSNQVFRQFIFYQWTMNQAMVKRLFGLDDINTLKQFAAWIMEKNEHRRMPRLGHVLTHLLSRPILDLQ